jgi:large subunit ribosomal protein L24
MPRRIQVGDLVQVTAGADRGRQGKVMAIDAEKGRVRVEKVRMQKHHVKPGRKIARSGGIIEQEGYIHASNVMLVDPQSGRPSRVGVAKDDQGKRIRVFRKSGEPVPTPAGR